VSADGDALDWDVIEARVTAAESIARVAAGVGAGGGGVVIASGERGGQRQIQLVTPLRWW
jgi:hypothetical protein